MNREHSAEQTIRHTSRACPSSKSNVTTHTQHAQLEKSSHVPFSDFVVSLPSLPAIEACSEEWEIVREPPVAILYAHVLSNAHLVYLLRLQNETQTA